ncbi:Asp-tRNA(Asn)/Glu-tRNA(Gln) amidotransferase subunit GatC [Vagococcus jeotgali]|uniref:Asp-tRNA(Asn)/Glu-tRNA(Gln) amidotransferase subunit GatC n=1 Tax=Vagococcus jeotgali TaxID=3109030 RepID=UPI002DD89EA6|nr:Asp-tRNA(Asn)/Glu-tRNA(Gln) amidotransferase subunit GatC [Vagococcus sp. B2T-5]
MAISKEEVQRVAALSKLSFSDTELDNMTNQLGKIIDMMENLEKVDTTGVPFTSNVTEEVNIFRSDKSIAGEDRAELLKNVHESESGYIKVPAIMDNGEAGA